MSLSFILREILIVAVFVPGFVSMSDCRWDAVGWQVSVEEFFRLIFSDKSRERIDKFFKGRGEIGELLR